MRLSAADVRKDRWCGRPHPQGRPEHRRPLGRAVGTEAGGERASHPGRAKPSEEVRRRRLRGRLTAALELRVPEPVSSTDGAMLRLKETVTGSSQSNGPFPEEFPFAGSDSAGERAAAMYSLIGSANLNGLDQELYLRTVLAQIADSPVCQIHNRFPWNLASSLQPTRPEPPRIRQSFGSISRFNSGPDYPDAAPFAHVLIAANPQRILWGSDRPHPWSRIERCFFAAPRRYGRLLSLLAWVPDAALPHS